MRHRSIPVLVALAGLALCPSPGAAQDEAPPIARYRVELMSSMQAHVGALRLLASGEVSEAEDLARHARAVRDITEMLLDVWPEGSGGEGTRALPSVWENWSDFQVRLETFREAGEALHLAVENGDEAGAADALRTVGQSCRSCHGDYRARPGR